MKHDIFEFNHIDNLLSEEEIKTLKEFYKYYHKKFWCFKETFKHFKIIDENITISGILLVIIGTISGGLTLISNSSWCNQWCWNTSDKFWENEKLQKENRNDKNSFYNL